MKPDVRILVVGGGYAGLMTALRLANRGLGACVTLVNASPELVERVRNHELGAGTPPPRRSIAHLVRGTGVQLVVGRVAALDPARRVARLDDGRELPWERLVVTLGSVADDGGVPGVREHALLIADEAGALGLRAARAAGARELVVVGGGLTGIETAAELAESGARVTLVTAGGIGSFLSPAGQRYLRGGLERLGVRIVEGAVRRVRAGAVDLVAGGTLACDACVWAGGFRAPPLARQSGLQVSELGRICVDARLRSLSHPDIYVAGDAAEPCFDAGSPLRAGCKYAMPMAVHAAENLARALDGRPERPFRLGDTLFCISLGRRDGLVQLARRDGTPGAVIRGRAGAWIKEWIVRFTIWSIELERRFAFYRWLPPPRRALADKSAPGKLAA